jgi:hypothetical protein
VYTRDAAEYVKPDRNGQYGEIIVVSSDAVSRLYTVYCGCFTVAILLSAAFDSHAAHPSLASMRLQIGPAETLFKPEFFLSMKNALAPNGIVATQVTNPQHAQLFHIYFVSAYICLKPEYVSSA